MSNVFYSAKSRLPVSVGLTAGIMKCSHIHLILGANIARYLHADQSPVYHPTGFLFTRFYVHVYLYIYVGTSTSNENTTLVERRRYGFWYTLSLISPGLFSLSSTAIHAKSYIIPLSSTLYMRLRSIFCLFASLNADERHTY